MKITRQKLADIEKHFPVFFKWYEQEGKRNQEQIARLRPFLEIIEPRYSDVAKYFCDKVKQDENCELRPESVYCMILHIRALEGELVSKEVEELKHAKEKSVLNKKMSGLTKKLSTPNITPALLSKVDNDTLINLATMINNEMVRRQHSEPSTHAATATA